LISFLRHKGASIFLAILLWLSTAWMLFPQKFTEHKLGKEESGITILTSNSHKIHLKSFLGNLKTAEITTREGEFSLLSADGYYFSGEEGKPQLPVQNRLFIIPPGTKPVVKVLSKTERQVDLSELGVKNYLKPRQVSLPKRVDQEKVKFRFDRKTYRKNEFLGEEAVQVEVLGIMRGHQIGRVSISPVLYNPVRNKLKVSTETEIEISFIPDQTPLKSLGSVNPTPYDDFLFRNFLNSPKGMLKSSGFPQGPMKYLILSHPMFRDALVPFVEWKTQKGFEVIEIYRGEDGVGSTNSEMRDYLKNIYDNSEGSPPVFLLIVGDHEQIPAFSASGHITDLYYAEYDGDGDYFPELFYGRFSAQTVEQLIPQLEKTLMYEKYEFPDPAYLDEVVMIAGVDSRYAPVHGNGHINYAVDYYLNPSNSIFSHTYLHPESGQNAQPIIQNISSGVGFVNYTGHGATDRWESPLFHITSIDTLENFGKYPVMIGNGCQTSRFSVSNSFGEALLRAEGKGAVGYIGGTNDTYWDEDYYWAVGLGPIVSNPAYEETGWGMYDKTFHSNGEPEELWALTQSQMMQAGNMAVTENGSRVKFYWEVYHVLGDPSLMVYFSQAGSQDPEFPAQLPVGAETIIVQAETHSYVALSNGMDLLDAQYTSSSGIVQLNFAAITEPGEVKLVITKSQKQPFMQNIPVIDYASAYVVHQSVEINDAAFNHNQIAESGETISLDLTIKNHGAMDANDLTIMLTSDDPYVNIIDGLATLDQVLSNASASLIDIFELSLSNETPDKHQAYFTLSITDEFANLWTSGFVIEIRSPDLVLERKWFENSSGERINLMAGERAFLHVELNNKGGAYIQDLQGTLSVTNPQVQIPVSTDFTGELLPDESVILRFEVELSSDFPYGSQEEFQLEVESPGYSKLFALELTLNGLFEDFESGSFDFMPWTNQSPTDWFVEEPGIINLSRTARSGGIGHNQTTSLYVQMDVEEESEIAFWLRVSSEAKYDYLRFYINDVEIENWSGNLPWREVTFPVFAGINEFRWTYTKDGTVSKGEDAVWIDNVLFPKGSFLTYEDILDVGIGSVLKPISGDDLGDLQVIEVEVHNYGNMSVSNIPVTYSINSSLPVQEVVHEVIEPGGSSNFGFSTMADLSAKGNYELKVFTDLPSDQNRMNDTITVTILHSDPTGIDLPESRAEIILYPNPARDHVWINLPERMINTPLVISLTDMPGRVIMETNKISPDGIIDLRLSGVSPGIYFLRVKSGNEEFSEGIIIQ
jgi:hypothetical protein